jgi:hypothetical protein
MNDASDAISDLQSKWDALGDLDRARAVHAIHQAGTSLRELAKALKRRSSLHWNANCWASSDPSGSRRKEQPGSG